MAWFSGKVSLGNFPDFSEAVSKISESVKTIEKNFDNALGLDENNPDADASSSTSHGGSGLWSTDIMSFMGQKDDDEDDHDDVKSSEKIESLEKHASPSPPSSSQEPETAGDDYQVDSTYEHGEANVETLKPEEDHDYPSITNNFVSEEAEGGIEKSAEKDIIINKQVDEIADSLLETNIALSEEAESIVGKPNIGVSEEPSVDHAEQQQKDTSESDSLKDSGSPEHESAISKDQISGVATESNEVGPAFDLPKNEDEPKRQEEESMQAVPAVEAESSTSDDASEMVANEGETSANIHLVKQLTSEHETNINEQGTSSGRNLSDNEDLGVELEKVKKEMKLMETALVGAARQAQAKADEIAKLMNENEQLKSLLEDHIRKSNEAEVESLREEYHQRVSTLERKVYALTRERDTLRREQNKKSDAAAFLKEKDEIITQVMAEGEELSKKQAAQESTIRKLRAQIREFEEEKKGLTTKLQAEENKVESIKRDKAATEKLLQETMEKNQAEFAAQKEFYTNALSAAKEAEALAESRANDEARIELESRLKEAEEREAMLVQTLEELRQTLSRKEQQAVFREDMLRRDIEDLQKRYQTSERRCEELVTQIPESTRPLLRQIEAIQETTARKAEAWIAVERSLNSRLQEAEARAAGAEERERSVNERLSQTLSRINVLEAQILCLRTEQTQLARSLEKERQRAAESRQDYLALKEEADTHEGRVNQLQDTIRELKEKHKQELHEALTHRELLQQDIEREKTARLELEKAAHLQSSTVPERIPIARTKSTSENGLSRRLSSASSLSSMEESFYLQASLDSSDTLSERKNPGDATMSSYYLKSKTPNAFEAALRQKEGELASYMSRLISMASPASYPSRTSRRHNIVAYMDVASDNSIPYRPMIQFLQRSRIHYAITAAPQVHLRQSGEFWEHAAIRTVDEEVQIVSTVFGHRVVVTEAVIRDILHFDDTSDMPTQFSHIFLAGALHRMGYAVIPADQFRKQHLSRVWRYLAHIVIVCLSPRRAGFDGMSHATASLVCALAYNKPYNFSGYLFSHLVENVHAGEKWWFMYPRFLQLIFDSLDLGLPSDPYYVLHPQPMLVRIYSDCAQPPNRGDAPVPDAPFFGHVIDEGYVAPPEDGFVDVVPPPPAPVPEPDLADLQDVDLIDAALDAEIDAASEESRRDGKRARSSSSTDSDSVFEDRPSDRRPRVSATAAGTSSQPPSSDLQFILSIMDGMQQRLDDQAALITGLQTEVARIPALEAQVARIPALEL